MGLFECLSFYYENSRFYPKIYCLATRGMDFIGFVRNGLYICKRALLSPKIVSRIIVPATMLLLKPHFLNADITYKCLDHGYILPTNGILSYAW
jgi:hypothetical protein